MGTTPGALLFVYGTLRRSVGAPAFALFSRHADAYDEGSIQARLHDFGRYPGAIASDNADDRVVGEVFALRTPRPTLALLDRYEGVAGTRGDAPGLYARVRVPVATRRHGRVSAWTYLFVRDISRWPRIESGDYIAHLRGRPGFRPPSLRD